MAALAQVATALRPRWPRLRSAPVSTAYLAVLTTTTIVLGTASAREANRLLLARSTNLHQLARDPLHVLVASAFWLSTPWELLVWALVLPLVVATVERRLGGRRTVAVLAAGHVLATLVVAAGLWVALRLDAVEQSVTRARDVGPSYAVFAVAAFLAYLLDRRLRLPYLAGLVGYAAAMVVVSDTFTDYGHLTAIGVGLACYPLARRARNAESPAGAGPS